MSIRIKLFGLLAEAVGKDELQLNNVADTDTLKRKMIADYPRLENSSFTIAISKKIIKDNRVVNDGDEVVLLPPFAGG